MGYFFIFFLVIFFISMLYLIINSGFIKNRKGSYRYSFRQKQPQRTEIEVDRLYQSPKKELGYNQHYFTNKKVLITGELRYFKTRNELAKLLWENGATIQKTFNSTIDVLIVGKSNIDALKLKSAYFQNIKVITEEELLNYFPDFNACLINLH